ncbi:MAG: hydantoinase B/oxoprolinase family protein, partial [Acidobacteriota bacterium]|nr:hydantoinase B/oxoprolinase family protein [Acidobacteriota bacterium]
GTLRVERTRADETASAARAGEHAGSREVELELFTHRFETIAREMGRALERSAVSTNVKERLDFSCAVLDADGRLVVNAPHVPVHLGSLGLCVRRVAEHLPLAPGDVVVTNHPAFGGSHLPDVTVITPVFAGGDTAERERIGFVAARAHHAEIGGTRPGSMPPRARRLSEEGVVIPPFHLYHAGTPDWDRFRRLLVTAQHPSRAIDDNLADARAAVASCRRGAAALEELARREGVGTVRRFMALLEQRAAERLGDALTRLDDGERTCRHELDDGTPLAVRVAIRGGSARIDFTGTGGVHAGNLNATPAIVRSAVLYVMRLLIAEPLPLNEGMLEAVSIEIPHGLLDPGFPEDPRLAPAVVGGNVETSQRLVNALCEALSLCAASQGTMNNVLFGDERSSYYETVCGGCGAGPDFDGASAVHSHMTNTRITDPEILETRFPVRLERFCVRRGSGGAGRHRGGDGVVRELVFLAPLELSVLTQHRTHGPRGLAGGEPGRPGRQRIVRAGGEEELLASIDEARVGPGDRLILETPGGGGYGRPEGSSGP